MSAATTARRAAVRARMWPERRDDAIVALHAAGTPLRAIGALTGLSHGGVAAIVKRNAEQVTVDQIHADAGVATS
jgi:hypothetical protein